jgi:hypothetical protein
MMLGILTGVYAAMFRAFDLKKDLDIFGLSDGFGLSDDAANGVAAALLCIRHKLCGCRAEAAPSSSEARFCCARENLSLWASSA